MAGRLDTADVRADAARILAPLADVEVLVMACTHYPALAPLFAAHCPRASLFDPADAALAELERAWGLQPSLATKAPRHRFLTTGSSEAMQRSARLAFGRDLPRIDSVAL